MTDLQTRNRTFWLGVWNGTSLALNAGFNIWMEFYVFSEGLSIWAQEFHERVIMTVL